MWPIGWYRSVLFDKRDATLRRLDRRIRRSLAKGFPGRWTPPTSGLLSTPDETGLLHIYKSLFLSDPQESLNELRHVFTAEGAAQIRARALSLLVQSLCMISINERGEGQTQRAEHTEKECRQLCDNGFREFNEQHWSKAIASVLHAVLGSLDYHAGDALNARLHFTNALEAHRVARDSYARHNPAIGLVYLCLGNLSRDMRDYEAADKYYRAATKLMPSGSQANVYAYRASVLIALRRQREARRVLHSAMKLAVREGASGEFTTYLQRLLVDAERKITKEESLR